MKKLLLVVLSVGLLASVPADGMRKWIGGLFGQSEEQKQKIIKTIKETYQNRFINKNRAIQNLIESAGLSKNEAESLVKEWKPEREKLIEEGEDPLVYSYKKLFRAKNQKSFDKRLITIKKEIEKKYGGLLEIPLQDDWKMLLDAAQVIQQMGQTGEFREEKTFADLAKKIKRMAVHKNTFEANQTEWRIVDRNASKLGWNRDRPSNFLESHFGGTKKWFLRNLERAAKKEINRLANKKLSGQEIQRQGTVLFENLGQFGNAGIDLAGRLAEHIMIKTHPKPPPVPKRTKKQKMKMDSPRQELPVPPLSPRMEGPIVDYWETVKNMSLDELNEEENKLFDVTEKEDPYVHDKGKIVEKLIKEHTQKKEMEEFAEEEENQSDTEFFTKNLSGAESEEEEEEEGDWPESEEEEEKEFLDAYKRKIKEMSIFQLKEERGDLAGQQVFAEMQNNKTDAKLLKKKLELVKKLIEEENWPESEEEEEEKEFEFFESIGEFKKRVDGMFLDELEKEKIDDKDPKAYEKYNHLQAAIKKAKEEKGEFGF